MKCRIAISVLTITFSLLISGCVSVKPCFSNVKIMGFKNSNDMVYNFPGNFSDVPSSGRLSSSNKGMINVNKGNLKFSISFPPSARLEF
ncbi:MAG: hypothetical protein GX654_14825 [Desulfatiglans sp.]|jgi:hypothetical protein|nr:hypothetical protein [Desulfatiglans sp.]